jgi:hypothetical protein
MACRPNRVHGAQGFRNFLKLTVNPGLASLFWRAVHPYIFHARQQGGIQKTIGQRLPGFNFCALAAIGGNQLANGDKVSRYSTMTRESKTASPPSKTKQGTLPNGLEA